MASPPAAADRAVADRGSPRRYARLGAIFFLDGFRAAPGWMALVTVMLVLAGVAGTCYPLGYRLLVDGALSGSIGAMTEGIAVVAGMLGLAWALTAIGATEAMALSDRIAVYRTAQLIELISGVPGLEHLERPDYLTEVERLNAGRRQLAAAPRQILTNVTAAARIIALLVLLGSVSPWLLLLPVTAIPPLACDRLAKRITRSSENAMAADRRLAGMLFELACDAESAGELRSYGLGGLISARHAALAAGLDRRARAEAVKVLAVQGAGWLLYAAGLMAAIGFTVVRAADGAITLGTVLMTVSLIRRSRSQLASAASGSGALAETLATADRLLWLEDHHARSVARYGTDPAPGRLVSGITLRDVAFCYPGTQRPVLSQLTLHIPAGATVAVIGENGSGKTTLVKLLLGMYAPTAGTIMVDDAPLSGLSPASWRARCTAAFQDFSRFSLPAVSSVGVGEVTSHASEPLALAALHRAGAGDLVGQLPAGLGTRVGGPYTGGHNLSGGQWQKVALGRAMRRPDPLLVVLDEPTASLDAQAEHELFTRYASAAADLAATAGTITLLVSHRFSTVRMADLIVYLDEGSVVEAGSHSSLMAAGGRYAEAFRLQAAGYE
ncbi:MAG TPA: ABC transporter ATP-binding protein [Trebonia sp.]|nr:ABC transporter ATP-binding protein [Trebonia sp.]